MNMPKKTKRERVLHAVSFELIAVLIAAPLLSWVLNVSLGKMGVLTVTISLVAMVWNMLYNGLFDRLQQAWAFSRTLAVRIAHALGFELGLIVFTLPLAAWWLGIGLWQALLLEAGVLLFFLPYTLGFNWAYDALRSRWLERGNTQIA
ncbi:multidrug/biocide efflux PACE transporter [Dyella silvatica]|uniref:multidrug/biocide efflux PACE transporter n=1 Tax=Dyella silvatica TaxID=2992128 RepID=UPI00224F92BF|nr:multidrug/biocide efflux PACE transporter [Dyella silvatica]